MEVDPEEGGILPEEDNEGDAQAGRAIMLRIFDGKALTGQINETGHAEWDWSRVPDALGMKTDKDHVLLVRNKENFKQDFALAQVSWSEFIYNNREKYLQGHSHRMQSRGLVLMVCLILIRKQVKVSVKEKAVTLLKHLVDFCMQGASDCFQFVATIFGTDFQYHTKQVEFHHGTTTDLHDLFSCHSKLQAVWQTLSASTWHGHRFCCTLSNITFIEVLLLLLYAKSMKGAHEVWRDIGHHMWPLIIYTFGHALETCAQRLASQEPEAAPLLKGKHGGSRKVPTINNLMSSLGQWVLIKVGTH